MTNLTRVLVASCFAAGLAAPAFAAETKPVATAPVAHHAKATKAKAAAAPKSETDILNAQSLQAAQAGQNFAPAASK
nr:hypothetical protein [uncultured Rhodopila sp.]